MLRKIFFSVSFIILCFSVAVASDFALLSKVRTGFYEDKVRFVFDFETPVKNFYTYFTSNGSPALVLELPECHGGKNVLSMAAIKRDRLVDGISVERVNFRRLRFTIKLKYDIPESNLKSNVIADPEGSRLVLDIHRNYSVHSSYKISPNLSYTIVERGSAAGYTRFADVKIDMSGLPKPDLDIISAKSGREKTSLMRTRTSASVAVNGGFFAWSGGNLGLVARKGVLISSDVKRRPPRTAFALTDNGRIIIDKMVARNGNIFLLSGENIKNVDIAIGGGPRLVKNSREAVDAKSEALGPGGNDITRLAGRTALGVDVNGNIHMCTATGYFESHAEGVRLDDMARFMISRGIKDGVNLDGGGSSFMDILGTGVSLGPGSDGVERAVGNAVAVTDSAKPFMPYSLVGVKSDRSVFSADGRDGVTISAMIIDASGAPVPDGTSVKIIPSIGRAPFYVKTSEGSFSISIGAMKVASPIKVSIECATLRACLWEGASVTGEPEFFYSNIGSELVGSVKRPFLEIVAEDKYGNPVSKVPLKVELISEAAPLILSDSVTGTGGIVSFFLKDGFYSGGLKVYYLDKLVSEVKINLPGIAP